MAPSDRTVASFHATMTGANLRAAYRELRQREADQIEHLVLAAMDVLHHDRTVGSEVDKYECMVLRQKFNEILHPDK